MKPIQLAMAACLLQAAGWAHGQSSDALPVLETGIPAPMRSLSSYPGMYAGNQGLPPADPLAPDYYRADPKLYAGWAFSPQFGIDLQFTNPGYRDGVRFRGHGPRLAESVALGAHGYNLDLTARAVVPFDERTDVFGTVGVSASGRKYVQGNTSALSPIGSVGFSSRINSKQTATVEIPLGVAAKRLSGNSGGVGATVKLGF